MSSQEYLEIKNLLLEQKAMLNMLIPNNATVRTISDMTGKSRQTITKYLKENFEPETDWWQKEKGATIYLSKTTTVALLKRYNK